MRLIRFLEISLKDKVDSLLFNGSEFPEGDVDEIVSILNKSRGEIKRRGFVDEVTISRLSEFSADKDIGEIVSALNGLNKINKNNDSMKKIEGKIFLRSMNTFNEKCLVLFLLFSVLAYFGKISLYGVDYSGEMLIHMGLYVPLSLLTISVLSGKNKIFESIEWSILGVFVRDNVRLGSVVRKLAFERGVFRLTPISFVFIAVSVYFLVNFNYSYLGIAGALTATLYLILSFLFFLSRIRNEGLQDRIARIRSENSSISRNFK